MRTRNPALKPRICRTFWRPSTSTGAGFPYEQTHSFSERKSRLQGTAFWGPEVALLGPRDRNRTSNEINTHDVSHFLLVQAWIRLIKEDSLKFGTEASGDIEKTQKAWTFGRLRPRRRAPRGPPRLGALRGPPQQARSCGNHKAAEASGWLFFASGAHACAILKNIWMARA